MTSITNSSAYGENNYELINEDRYKLKASFSKKDVTISLEDSWHLQQGGQIQILFPGPKYPARIYLKKLMKRISVSHNKFAFQVVKREGVFYIIFGKYGLQGGGTGKWSCILGGGTLALGGLGALAAGPFLALPSAGIFMLALLGGGSFGAGMAGLGYGIKTKEPNIALYPYLTQMGEGAVGGSVAGACVGAGAALTPFLHHACATPLNLAAQATGGAASEAVLAVIKGDHARTYREIFGRAFALGIFGGVVGYGAQMGIDKTFLEIFAEAVEKNPVLAGALKGVATNGLQTFVTTAFLNEMEGEECTKNLSTPLLTSMSLGALTGGLSAEFEQIKRAKLVRDFRDQLKEIVLCEDSQQQKGLAQCSRETGAVLKQIEEISDEELLNLIENLTGESVEGPEMTGIDPPSDEQEEMEPEPGQGSENP